MILDNPHQPRLLPIASTTGCSVNVIPVPLRRGDPSSPWCYAASISPSIPLDDDDDDEPTPLPSPMLPPGANFLATQVWPSSRIASTIIEKYMDTSWTVCELGCGPGLPSLAAAKKGASRVIATDVDALALELVRAAAIEQGFVDNRNDVEEEKQQFVTRKFDLTSQDNSLPDADLYILSDVFESAAVAEGAAWHVQSILSNNKKTMQKGATKKLDDFSRVWVFAQSDRAQRDTFLANMGEWYENERHQQKFVGWTMDHAPDPNKELWLFDLEETLVEYN